ncbi:hypothetical protein OH692_00320 [Escherichia coli]|nr:hypothetical protein OH692_00320 [Escherichia coli]
MSNTVTLRTDGRLFTGWTSVSVTRSIESVAGYFELGVNVPPGTDLSGLAPGKKFTLEIEGQIVCTGYIDSRRRQMTADSMKITIAGRDKTADLIDCAAVYSGGQWKNRSLEQIARDLCPLMALPFAGSCQTRKAQRRFRLLRLTIQKRFTKRWCGPPAHAVY